MADFQAALKRGIESFKRNEKGRLEVVEVLREFKRQVHFGTDRQVMVVEAEVEGSPETLMLAGTPNNRQPGLEFQLLRYQTAVDGYPVSMAWGEHAATCTDRAALEAALEKVLEDPTVAARIYAASVGREARTGTPGVSVKMSAGD